MDPGLAAALKQVHDEVFHRYEGPSPESLARLTAFGKEAFDAVMVATRDPGPADRLDGRTCAENWDTAITAFARSNPRWLVEAFDRAPSGSQPSALVWILGYAPDPAIAPDLLRWLEHREVWVRTYSLQGLIRLRWEPAIPVLLDYLDRHPRREEVSEILQGMFVWDALRQPRAAASLRRVIEHLEKKKNAAGVLAWAQELLDCFEKGTLPAPRPPGFFS